MADDQDTAGDREAVSALARVAGLNLDAERIAIVAGILGEWTPGCHELNAAMNMPERLSIVPITVLAHRG